MRLADALKHSQTGYVERFDTSRGVKVVRSKLRQYIEVKGRLIPATCLDDVMCQDWQPVQGTHERA